MERPDYVVGVIASLARVTRFVSAETDITDIKLSIKEEQNRTDIVIVCDVGKMRNHELYSRQFRDQMMPGIFMFRCQPTGKRLLLILLDDVEYNKKVEQQRRRL